MMACMKDGFVEGSLLNGRYQTLSPLNHGSFGMVFLAKDTTNGELVAIKCLTKSAATATALGPAPQTNDHLVDLECHERLGAHPNIVNLLDSFETTTHMFLILEYCSMGDLYEAISKGRGPLETEHVRSFMLQLVDAVEFMHAKGVYHRDIKPENIFLAQDGSMKLGDFGLSTAETWTYEASVGSDRYMAPEQYDPANEGYSPAQADIWSIGICLLNILFSKNPFVTPSEVDLLFSDFVRDKQSLFDLFPAMSQDTFEVLIHAMAIDPKKRSLAAVRNALHRVLSFTTDDEIFDDFCTEEREVVPASANRQPLRTPSIQSPPIEQGGAFPWAKALHFTQSSSRQLSAIPDTEIYTDEAFPATTKLSAPWYSSVSNTVSMASVLDSALGASVKSMNLREPKPKNTPRADVAPVVGSLPVPAAKPVPALASVFGNKDVVSKSWSDLWDEEEEELEDMRRKLNDRNWSSESIDEDVTVRQRGLSEIENPSVINSRTRSPPLDHHDNPGMVSGSSVETVGSFDHIAHTAKTTYKLPGTSASASKSSIMDKWAALGNRRRAFTSDSEDKPEEPRRKRTQSGIWRRGMKVFQGNAGTGGHQGGGAGYGWGVWDRKDTPHKDISGGSGGVRVRDYWRRDHGNQHQYHFEKHAAAEDDVGDLEWVGGWQDFHLS